MDFLGTGGKFSRDGDKEAMAGCLEEMQGGPEQ